MTGASANVIVPKCDLIAAALVALQSDQLKIAAKLAHAATVVKELQAMRVTISPAGHDSYAARTGEHDDLVLALCLALWAAKTDDPQAYTGIGGGEVKPAGDRLFSLDDDPYGSPWRW